MSEIVNGIRRINENTYDIYIREQKRRAYRRSLTHKRPGIFALPVERWWKGGVKPSKDSQRQRCYDAEHDTRPQITQRTYSTVREAATFFRNVMESDWFQRRFPHFFQLKIEFQPGTRAAHAGPREHTVGGKEATRGWIGFSTWAMGERGQGGGEMIMLHELAHAILPRGVQHGRQWARVFLELVTHFMGKDVGAKLKAAMKAHKVKSAPVKTVSPERRAAMAKMLAGARALRGGLSVAACVESGTSVPPSTTESASCASASSLDSSPHSC